MDYMFYTPPNTEPKIDNSVPFDQEIALLEGKHYMAEQQLARAENEPPPIDKKDHHEAAVDQLKSIRASVTEHAQAVLEAREEKQEQWDEHRDEKRRQAAEDAGIEVPEVTG
jgi:hypothetical protein